MSNTPEVDRIKVTLDLIHQMQKLAEPKTAKERAIFNVMATESILQEPMVMADNLRYWLDLELYSNSLPAASTHGHSDPFRKSEPTALAGCTIDKRNAA